MDITDPEGGVRGFAKQSSKMNATMAISKFSFLPCPASKAPAC